MRQKEWEGQKFVYGVAEIMEKGKTKNVGGKRFLTQSYQRC